MKPDRDSHVTVEHLRRLIDAEVSRTSLRAVARAVGISPGGLKKFIQGSAPYSPTLRRLRVWYVGTYASTDASAAGGGSPDAVAPMEAGSERELLVIADLNAVPASALAELMGALDELHRAHGGGGLRISATHRGTLRIAGVAV